MEKHSEDQIYKNKPETRNGNVNADHDFRTIRMEFV